MNRIRLSQMLIAALAAAAVLPVAATPLPAGMTAVPLVAITNDRDTSISEIELMLNPAKLVQGLYIATYTRKDHPDEAKGQVIPLASLERSDGVVIGQGQGVKAILLHGKIAPESGNGTLDIRYISNGIFRKYKECSVHLRQSGPGAWQLVNAYDHGRINGIHVKTWALGISTLENVCPTDHA